MKTIIKRILVVAVMLGTYTSYASETLNVLPTIKLVNEGDHISVTNPFGKVIFSSRIKHSGDITKLFDFSQLSDGIYNVEIGKAFEIESFNFKVEDHKTVLITESQEKIFKPVIRTEDSQLIVSKIALDSNKMYVKLYFEDELIHAETIEGSENIINRVYRLDKTHRGNYSAVIKTNDRVYIKNFSL
ncbi:hypothetical protein [uncultured Winogradskyella sp.]|uniref:hypothetical protein n=1 Tax=uncultured Winogradskyella sp. TaxID=395353 RepID=UPI0026226F8D|nr:hypothetical protein [uncultured Winogradskyella sp.]